MLSDECSNASSQAVGLFLHFGTMLSHHTSQEFLSETRLRETSCCTPALTQRPQPASILHTWAQESRNAETLVGDDLKISDKGPETEEMGRSQDPNQCFPYMQNRRQSEPGNVYLKHFYRFKLFYIFTTHIGGISCTFMALYSNATDIPVRGQYGWEIALAIMHIYKENWFHPPHTFSTPNEMRDTMK